MSDEAMTAIARVATLYVEAGRDREFGRINDSLPGARAALGELIEKFGDPELVAHALASAIAYASICVAKAVTPNPDETWDLLQGFIDRSLQA